MALRLILATLLLALVVILASSCTSDQPPDGDAVEEPDAVSWEEDGAAIEWVRFGGYVGPDYKVEGFRGVFSEEDAVFGVVKLVADNCAG